MRIVLAAGLYGADIGGPATYANMLNEQLPGRGIEVDVVPFARVRSYPKIIRHVAYGWLIWRASKQADLVYALDPVSVGLPALLAARLRRIPFVLRLGGDFAWEQGRVRFGVTSLLDDFVQTIPQQPLAVRILSAVQSYVARRAHVVVVPSEYLKRIVMQWDVESDRIQVIYSNLVPLESTEDILTVRQTHNLTSPVMTTAARLVPWKGIDAVIDVLQNLLPDHPGSTLVIIGDGPERAALEAKVQKYDLANNVRFTGAISQTELANIVSASDLFILNTAYEGLSHQLLEVMSLEVPIVTTNVGGNPELLSDGVDASLVSYDDVYAMTKACIKIIADKQYTDGIVRFAKARTKDFSKETSINAIDLLLKTVYERT